MSFDLAKYQIGNDPRKVTVKIPETGDSFEVTVKNLSWSRQNRLLSNSVTIGKDGSTAFDGDAYVKSYLKEFILEALWSASSKEAFMIATICKSISDNSATTSQGMPISTNLSIVIQ